MPSSRQTRRDVLVAAAAAGVTSLTGCLGRVAARSTRVYKQDAPVGPVTGAWPTYQHDFANTGATTDSGPSNEATSEGVAAGDATLATSVALADGRGFVGYSDGNGDAGAYRGFKLGDSNASWTVEYSAGKSTPTLAGNAMFVSTAEFLAAYDARDGTLCWRTNVGGYGSATNAPVLAEDTLLDDSGETVYGRNPATGKERWQYDAGSSGTALAARDGVAYTVVGANHEDAGVAALNPATGEENWRRDDLPQSLTTLTVDDRNLYYAAHQGAVYALSLDDGTTQWTASVPLPEDGSAYVAVADGNLHVQSPDGKLATFDTADGSVGWRRTLSATSGPGSRPPVIAGDVRYVLCDEVLYALDAETGALHWSHALDVRPALTSAPAIRGSALYYAGLGRNDGVFRVASTH